MNKAEPDVEATSGSTSVIRIPEPTSRVGSTLGILTASEASLLALDGLQRALMRFGLAGESTVRPLSQFAVLPKSPAEVPLGLLQRLYRDGVGVGCIDRHMDGMPWQRNRCHLSPTIRALSAPNLFGWSRSQHQTTHWATHQELHSPSQDYRHGAAKRNENAGKQNNTITPCLAASFASANAFVPVSQ